MHAIQWRWPADLIAMMLMKHSSEAGIMHVQSLMHHLGVPAQHQNIIMVITIMIITIMNSDNYALQLMMS